MGQDFRSANWYRVAHLRPRLAPQLQVRRQRFRGLNWYVLFDPVTQRTLRLTPQAWHVVARMDGRQTVAALWDDAALALGRDTPPQDDLIQLLAQLHEANLLLSDAMPDLDELLRRRDRHRREVWQRNAMNPLSIRLRLWDPDAFLERSLPAVRWLFGRWGAVLWLALCLPAAVLVGLHWRDLSHGNGSLLSAERLLSLLLVYPLVKGLHELAHAWAAKAGGAEVHDMGLMFLVFAPVPYVDASGSSAFADKRRRALVAAAGMLTEMALGALALFVWLAVEPGLVRSQAFSVMLIGGVSTLLFNGNPLLRYDGYFVLCDLIETPNLAQRSNQFWSWLTRHYAFGLTQAQPPLTTAGERWWLAAYAPASFAYRIAVTTGIALFLGREYLYVGLGVGLWGLAALLLWPLLKGLHHVATAAELSAHRTRAMVIGAGLPALLLLALVAVPVPLSTYAQGVVWPADNAQLRAAEPGFVARVVVQPGATVAAGEVVLVMVNDQLHLDRETAAAREQRQQLGYVAALAGAHGERETGHGRVLTAVQQQEWGRAEDELAHADNRLQRLTIATRRAGVLELPRAADLPGRWVRQGELLGHLKTGDAPIVRVVVTQDDIDLVRARLLSVEVRLAGDPGPVWPATLLREVPAGDAALPSMALAVEGGGLIAMDTRDTRQPRTLNRVFQFDLLLPPEAAAARAQIGERAHVRFVHASEPFWQQAWRRLRQLLLSQLAL
jgi:putative peptide zinc metalloprotease protein